PVIDKRQCDQARHGYRKARTRREVPTSMPEMGGIKCFELGLIHRQMNAFKAFTSARISPYRGHEKTGKSRFFSCLAVGSLPLYYQLIEKNLIKQSFQTLDN
ncbi:hypothetical protein, partial [Pseudomonas poae]|uniref:hypothetical protein n=1 Tax=Pseudomonas poae TaxID=200451 RepID=UPI001F2CE190